MLIKQTFLRYQDEKSDKVYEVKIVYHGWNKYQVNFSYGRTGCKLKSDTKTKISVSLKEAEIIFDRLVNSKQKKGYNISDFQSICYEDLLEISLPERQKIINEIKQQEVSDFLEELKKVGFNLREDLAELDLSHTNLSNADLKGCNLYQTNLVGADLRGAKLQGVILEKSKIDETTQIDPKWRLVWELVNLGGENRDLKGVDLSDIEINFIDSHDDDSRVNLTGANLEGANFSNSSLYQFDFTNANLKNANLSGSEHAFLAGACLSGADLSDTCFITGYFNDAVCINTNFSRASFWHEDSHFRNANCRGANFQEAHFTLGEMNGANFSCANFSGATGLDNFFVSAIMEQLTEEVNFQGANFTNTDLSGVNFSQIKLINLTGAIFDGANLKNANLSGLNLSNTSFKKANLQGANLENCNLSNADLTDANLEDVKE